MDRLGLLSERKPLAEQITGLLSSAYQVDPAACVIVVARPDRSRALRERPRHVIRVGTPDPDDSDEQVIRSLTVGTTLASI